MNVSISSRPKPADGCNRWLSGRDEVYNVGDVKRSALDHHHAVPQPGVLTGTD